MESCAGGVVGKNSGLVESCRNEGAVSCARVAGGIAGANSGTIAECENTGDILLLAEHARVTRLRYYENEERVAAGISGYNTGSIRNCANEGGASMESAEDTAGYVFGIAQNASTYFCQEGRTENCYYLAGKTAQKYRQRGVHKLSAKQMENVEEYLCGPAAFEDVKEKIRRSAEAYLGEECMELQFYRYRLENGEGLLAEFIGMEVSREDSGLLEAVRYLAASVDQEITVTQEPVSDSSEYLGRHDWEYETLHNPFALVSKGEWRVESGQE